MTRLDPRQVRTRRRVLAAARAVLRQEGIGGATIDAIATEAEVARSTLYRNWSTREELLAEAFDDLMGAPSRIDLTKQLREQLAVVLAGLARSLKSTEWGESLPSIVAAIAADPTLAHRYGRLTDEHRAAVAAIVRAGVAAGELPRTTKIDDLIDALVGPLFYRHLVRQLSTDLAWTRRHLDRTLSAFGHSPSRS
jgi:AcrR family transcriptional regulator